MFELIRIFITGLVISFLGALPLGVLNVAAMQVAVQESARAAIRFACGVALVEVLYVRLSLIGMNWVMAHRGLFNILEWVTVVLFIILAISSFAAARRSNKESKSLLLNNKLNRFWLGFTMSAVNPVQIPFWFIWSTYLLSNRLLNPVEWQYNVYTAGIGTGTLIALAVFIFGGKWLVNRLKTSNRMINYIVGAVFVISAGIQCWRLLTAGR
jgi:threonine/homoserine/homoserine lactone efflux protein